MKSTKAIAVLSLAFLLGQAAPVSAQEVHQEQELKQELEIKCTAGAYGQDSTCEAYGYQDASQSQTVTLADGTVVEIHEPVDTALDFKTSAGALGILTTGALSFVARKKFLV